MCCKRGNSTHRDNDILGNNKFGISCAIFHQNGYFQGKRELFTLHASSSRSSFRPPLLALCILLQSGDIQPHPGPYTKNLKKAPPKYQCGVCDKNVSWNARATQCDCCDIWFHAKCIDMGIDSYQHLCNNSVSWICHQCGLPNFASSFFTSSNTITLENSFSPLSTAQIVSPNLDTPYATSTPLARPQQQRHQRPSPQQLFGPIPPSPIVDQTNQAEVSLLTQSMSIDTISSSDYETSSASHSMTSVFPDKNPEHLRILVINFQCITNKQESFVNVLRTLSPNIVIGTETWLNNGHIDAEIFPADTPDELRYQIVRRDREKHTGGVIIFSKPGLMCTRETDLETNCEIIWTKLKLARDKSVLIGSYYRPPTIDSLDQLQESILQAQRLHPSSTIYLGGDFNLASINWDTHSTTPGGNFTRQSQLLLDILTNTSL